MSLPAPPLKVTDTDTGVAIVRLSLRAPPAIVTADTDAIGRELVTPSTVT